MHRRERRTRWSRRDEDGGRRTVWLWRRRKNFRLISFRAFHFPTLPLGLCDGEFREQFYQSHKINRCMSLSGWLGCLSFPLWRGKRWFPTFREKHVVWWVRNRESMWCCRKIEDVLCIGMAWMPFSPFRLQKKLNEQNRVGGTVLTTSSSSLSYCHSYSDSPSSTYGFR